MTGKIICLFFVTACILVLLWLSASGKEKNKKDAAKVMVMAGLLGLVICITEDREKKLKADGTLLKNEAGEDMASEDLQLNVEGILEDYNYTVEVEAQKLQGAEMEKLFDAAAKEAEQKFLGENVSLDCIDRKVVLPKKLQNGQIRANWKFDPENIIDEDGEVRNEKQGKDGTLVMVSLTMDYFGEMQEHSFGCLVFKRKLNRKEQVLSDLQEYMEQEQEASRNRAYFRLPLKLNGTALRWSQKSPNTYRIILLLGFLAAAIVYIRQDMKDQQKEQKRKEQLLRQYPDMVSKISLLLGAGMTFSSAWERIVLNYLRQLERQQAEPQEVYEQMLLAYREMQDGVGELKVYERFGERCGTPQYRKLTMLIIQNLRKGSAGLRQILEKEVTEAFALRKNHAKKAGEEAGTKILVPMMLMLCIVMVIILVPAFLTFQMQG